MRLNTVNPTSVNINNGIKLYGYTNALGNPLKLIHKKWRAAKTIRLKCQHRSMYLLILLPDTEHMIIADRF